MQPTELFSINSAIQSMMFALSTTEVMAEQKFHLKVDDVEESARMLMAVAERCEQLAHYFMDDVQKMDDQMSIPMDHSTELLPTASALELAFKEEEDDDEEDEEGDDEGDDDDSADDEGSEDCL